MASIVDPDVTGQARRALDATGYADVDVIMRDGALGAPEHAPYDRVVVTVGAWDLPSAWWDQVGRLGRLVVPLRWRGQSRSVAFVRDGGRLRSESLGLCGFVPMVGQDGERSATIDPDGHVTLCWDVDQPVDPSALHGVLGTREVLGLVRCDRRGKRILRRHLAAPDRRRGVHLSHQRRPCRVEAGVCTPAIPSRTPTLVDGGSIAYLAIRRQADGATTRRWEFGAIAHGPEGRRVADRLIDQVHAWSRDRSAQPILSAYPAAAAAAAAAGPAGGRVIEKHESRLVVSF